MTSQEGLCNWRCVRISLLRGYWGQLGGGEDIGGHVGGGWIGKGGERSARATDSQRCTSFASRTYLIYLPT
jgi:hypothetical protein